MGDVLLATPLVRAVRKALPATQIDVLAEAVPAQVLRNNPDISNVIVSPNRGAGIGDYLPLIKKLRATHYDLVIDGISTPGSALLTRLTGARFRIGYRLPRRTWAYTDPVIPNTEPSYAPLMKAPLLKPIWLSLDQSDQASFLPRLYPTAEDSATGLQLQPQFDDSRTPIGLAPYCRRASRMWAVENWVELVKGLSRKYHPRWLLFAAPSERPLLAPLETLEGVDLSWVGASDLLVAAGVMQRTRCLLGGENGLLHLAVAADVPTYTLFAGKDEPLRWVPPGIDQHSAVDLRGVDAEKGVTKASEGFAEWLEQMTVTPS